MIDALPANSIALLDFVAQRAAERKKSATDGGADAQDNTDNTDAAAQGADLSELQTRLRSEEEIKADMDAAKTKEDEFRTKEDEFREKMDRRMKIDKLSLLDIEKKSISTLKTGRQNHIKYLEKIVNTPPVEAVSLEGDEAKAALKLARQVAASFGGLGFPPPKNGSFGFTSGGFSYSIRGDGRVLRSLADVPTPENIKSAQQQLAGLYRQSPALEAAEQQKLDDIDNQMSALKSELGISDDSWKTELQAGPGLSITV